VAESILIEALGVPILLALDGLTDAEASAVRSAWVDAMPAVASDSARDAAHTLVVRESGDGSDLPSLLERLSQSVTLAAIDARRGDLWMLHAAGLALDDGRVVVLVGPSGRGKTTASRALGRVLGYVSDETIAIDTDGRIHPYRKPLSIIEEAGAPKSQRPPSEVGLRPLPAADLTLAVIVLLDRRAEGPDEPLVEVLDLGDALEELVSQTSYLAAAPHPLAVAARLIAPLGGVRRVVYREAETLIGVVDALVAPPDAVASWRAVDPAVAGGDQGYVRTPTLDVVALEHPDRLAILHDSAAGEPQVQLLGGIAPALWLAASAVSRDELVAATLAAHGEPADGDAAGLVDAALAELVEAGVLHYRQRTVWQIADGVAWTDDGDRVAVLDVSVPAAQAVIMADSAATIWRALAETGTTSDIVARVAVAAGRREAEVSDDVVVHLRALAGSRLVCALARP
jgi:hypothetical protein